MAVVVLSLHLLVCICLIGLVLLQRSEGGALGMGGGGGGALMSGRGAADALAKMTSFAGAFFLATSLGLTVISGAASNNRGSVFDRAPVSAPAAVVPAAPAAQPEQQTPDPLESSAPQASDTQLAAAPAPQVTLAPSSAAASTRAGPVTQTAAPQTTTAPRTQPASTNPPAPRTTTNVATTQRPAAQPAANTTRAATTRPAGETTTRAAAPAPLVLPHSSGAALTLDDEQLQPENGLTQEPVRRERAGPDQ